MSTIGSDTPSTSRDLVISDDRNSFAVPAQRKALEEDEYLGRMAKIIKRDFFSEPELGEIETTPRDLIESERTDNGSYNTPGTDRTGVSTTSSVRSRREACSMRLNDFLSKYTSEDNEYFDKLQAKELKRHRLRFPWLYRGRNDHSRKNKGQLGLKNRSGESLVKDSEKSSMIEWMHDSKDLSLQVSSGGPMNDLPGPSTVNYESSKYMREPLFKDRQSVSESKEQTKTGQNRFTDKIGIDGKLLNGSETPSMNGYSYIPPPETPQLVPETVRVKQESNRFYLPSESPRDLLAHRLYEDKIARKIRTPKSSTRSDTTKTPKNKLDKIF